MRRATASAAALAVAVLATAAALPAVAQDPDAIEGCRRGLMKGLQSLARGRTATIQRCLEAGKYDGSCVETDFLVEYHENELRNRVAGAGSDCQAALDAGSTVAEFGPTSCANEWDDCDAEVPAITTLDDVAECLVCQQRGHDLQLRAMVGMPRPEPGDNDEKRCTRRVAKLVTTAARRAIFDADACSKDAAKPFACPVDASTDTRFGRALASFDRKIANCGIDEGRAPDALMNLCGGTATDAASLSACFQGLARCFACRTMNAALDQDQDCLAFSGFTGCDGMF